MYKHIFYSLLDFTVNLQFFSISFRIFAGTAVISNYFLMITWLPATVSIVEQMTCLSPKCCKQSTNSFYAAVTHIGNSIEDVIISAVVNMPKLWIISLGKYIFVVYH